MTLDADALVDRRRTRRKLIFWRAAAFTIAVAAVIAAGLAFGWGDGVGAVNRPHIARVTIDGVIVDDRAMTKMIGELAEDDAVAAV
ncbi:MAG TPA: signal peptide peptidase SppA, partial [Methylomirabilota bacterium]|nr:signal peptide peptidase SppA [Methylomirabilota bacterium]